MTTYDLATIHDDALLRALLRDNVIPSWVSMTVAREPSYFAGADRFGRDWAVIARHNGSPIGMYTCSEQQVHLNGMQTELGYLGGLRLNRAYRNRFRILREGYNSIRAFSSFAKPKFWYTAIATDNQVARRILEANLSGMPRYTPLNNFVTLALPKARGSKRCLWRQALSDEMERICSFYNQHAAKYQFSPVLTPETAFMTGASFYVMEQGNELKASMALWNQQSYKQVVASAYRRPLGTLLPLYNAYTRLARKTPLPKVGQAIDQTYLAFLAVQPNFEREITSLIGEALALCSSSVLTIGFHERHQWLASLKRAFRPASYETCIYTVSFDEVVELDGRPAQPEVAVL